MCGIAGICGSLSPDAAQRAQLMSDALAQRGPDGQGLWRSPSASAVLSHRRLTVIDLTDAGRQPMSTADRRFTISYNGEIYNYRQLRERLKKAGAIFRSHSDTEVLLELWARRGNACLDDIHGMYAFAVWDETEQTLTLVRDPFGIKPLYYRVLNGALAFASQLGALRCAGFAGEIDKTASRAFLQFGSIPAPLTLYRDVRALPPGTLLEFDARTGAASVRTYWDYGNVLRDAATSPMDQHEARERVRQSLLSCIREHLESDVPVGAFLSGGIDSTAVVSLMRQVGYSDLKTFSIGFDVDSFDETSYARIAAERYGTDHRQFTVTGADFGREKQNILSCMDQPTVDGVNVYFVSKHAAQAGLKVVTSGLGGDEFFQGYPYFRQIPRLLFAGHEPLRRMLLAATAVLGRTGDTRAARLREFLRGSRSLRRAYLACRRIRAAAHVSDLLNNTETSESNGSGEFEELFDEADLPVSLGKRITLLEARSYMANTLLRDCDVFSMAHSLELRLPLVYDPLARCLACVPQRLIRCNGHPKPLLVAAVGDLPGEIVNRPKMGFTFPLEVWLRAAAPHEFQARSWNRDAVERLQERFRAGRAGLAEFWSAVVLDHFLVRAGE